MRVQLQKQIPKQRSYRAGLSAAFVRQVQRPGRYCDGGGLYLLVEPTGSSRWLLRVVINGRRSDIGLGGSSYVTLAEARDKAWQLRRLAKSGEDPLAKRRAEREGVSSFKKCALSVHKSRVSTWRNGKHQKQWLSTLEAYVFPTIGEQPVNKIGTGEVLKVLLPIWTAKPETARRVLQRMRVVFDYATAAGLRSGENPCTLAVLGLPKQNAGSSHFEAMPYAKVPEFIADLRRLDASEVVRLALEFLILTAARSSEVRGLVWSEIGIPLKLWTVPPSRMKAKREHVVPLSERAIEILHEAKKLNPQTELVFPSARGESGMLSDMAFTMVLRRLELPFTVHGFRSSFRDWVSEETNFSGEVAEMALAHVVKNKVEAADPLPQRVPELI